MNTKGRSIFPHITTLVRARRAWVVTAAVAFGLAALVTVGGNNWRARAAGSRFVAVGGSDAANDCSNPGNPCATIQNGVNQAASGDTINVAAGTYFENVNVPAGKTLTIQGDETGGTIVDGQQKAEVFFNESFDFSHSLTLSGLTIRNGLGKVFHMVGQFLELSGGGITNYGTLTVIGCEITSNRADIGNQGTVGSGGGIFNLVTLTVINSTIHDNQAVDNGGGIEDFGNSTIVNSTIAHNSALLTGFHLGVGGFDHNLAGAGGDTLLLNNIIAFNTSIDAGNESGAVMNDHTLIGDGSLNAILSGDPKLGPLTNNGGNSTHFYPLLVGSPAIDAGNDSVLGSPYFLTTDQRGPGFPRLLALHVDIGAIEGQAAGPPSNFDTCIKDSTTGNLFLFNSKTGAYSFVICGQQPVTGTGKITVVGSSIYLTDFTTPGRKIQAYFNHGQLTGKATVTLSVVPGVYQTTIVNQTMPSNGQCSCQ